MRNHEESPTVDFQVWPLRQIHGAWDEVAKDMKWEEPELERWPTLRKAQERCQAWREALRA